jgi:hypothetical protein
VAADPPAGGQPQALDTFAKRLDFLFSTLRAESGKPYTHEQVAERIEHNQGISISANYIWMLRNGRRDNPTVRHVEGLARFFGVSMMVLLDQAEAERLRSQLAQYTQARDSGVEHVALRTQGADGSTLDMVRSLLAQGIAAIDAKREDAPPSDQQGGGGSE